MSYPTKVCPNAIAAVDVPFNYELTYGTEGPIQGFAELDISDNIKDDVRFTFIFTFLL